MFGLFLIRETQYGGVVVDLMDYVGTSYNLTEAREKLEYQINNLASKSDANETQPTKNHKDFFHFYVKEQNGFEEKRHMVISKIYKSKRLSLFMQHEAIAKCGAKKNQ